jgi:hypothetical protein
MLHVSWRRLTTAPFHAAELVDDGWRLTKRSDHHDRRFDLLDLRTARETR